MSLILDQPVEKLGNVRIESDRQKPEELTQRRDSVLRITGEQFKTPAMFVGFEEQEVTALTAIFTYLSENQGTDEVRALTEAIDEPSMARLDWTKLAERFQRVEQGHKGGFN